MLKSSATEEIKFLATSSYNKCMKLKGNLEVNTAVP
jgi:hypothetical protein